MTFWSKFVCHRIATPPYGLLITIPLLGSMADTPTLVLKAVCTAFGLLTSSGNSQYS